MQWNAGRAERASESRDGPPHHHLSRGDQAFAIFSDDRATADPELIVWPDANDENFLDAQALAMKAKEGTLEDLTGGAVSYYAKSMKTPPYWAATMIPTVQIGGQLYFRLGPAKEG